MDSLKAYVDENVSDLKDFIASVAKKLPMPVKFTTEQKRPGYSWLGLRLPIFGRIKSIKIIVFDGFYG